MKKLFTLLCICLCSIAIHAAVETGTCGDNLTWSYDSETKSLTITGSGAMADYDLSNQAPWNHVASSLLSVSLPEGLASIGNYAFYNCSGLTSIIIPESVTTIESYAFYNCSSLTSIIIPESVTSMGMWVFGGCSGLTSITIHDGVTSIGYYTFYGCSSLTSITIPESVTSIGVGAFSGCSGFISITITDGLTSIGDRAFKDCSSLISITIPESVTSIGNDAFNSTHWYNNQPDGVLYINHLLYKYKGEMPSNTSIHVKEGTTRICDSAFRDCSGLTSITIPESVTSIGYGAFADCSGLMQIVVDDANQILDSRDNCNAIIATTTNTLILGCKNTLIPESVTNIGYGAFTNCTSLTSITIPDGVDSIGDYAFYWCSNLTSITIPNAGIGHAAFAWCTSLTSVTIGNGVTNIGGGAFSDCWSLTSIILPSSITSIGERAFFFGEDKNLKSITCEAVVPIALQSNPFWGVLNGVPLYVPAQSVEAYKSAEVWKEFDVQALPAETSPADLTSLTVDGEEVSGFLPSRLEYDVELPEQPAALPVLAATPADEDAKVVLIQATTMPGQASAVVIAPDGTIQTYTVRFTVATSSDATLSALRYNGIDVPDFTPERQEYDVLLPYNTETIPVVSATASHASAKVVVVQPASLPGQASVVVVAPDGTATNTYTLRFSLAASADASLSLLTYDGVSIPSFDPGTYNYIVELSDETQAIPWVDALAADEHATLTIHQALTLPGEASVEVLAADGITTQTYTIYFSKRSTPTSVEDAFADPSATPAAEKRLIDGQVLILRDGKTYTLLGQEVR